MVSDVGGVLAAGNDASGVRTRSNDRSPSAEAGSAFGSGVPVVAIAVVSGATRSMEEGTLTAVSLSRTAESGDPAGGAVGGSGAAGAATSVCALTGCTGVLVGHPEPAPGPGDRHQQQARHRVTPHMAGLRFLEGHRRFENGNVEG